MCIDIVEINLGLLMGKFRQFRVLLFQFLLTNIVLFNLNADTLWNILMIPE